MSLLHATCLNQDRCVQLNQDLSSKMNDEIPIYNFHNLKNNFGFEIQSFEHFFHNTKPNEVEIYHRVSFYIIILISKGKGQHIIDFKKYDYESGSILFIAKNQVHAFRLNKKTEGFLLFFNEEFLHQNQIQFNDLSYSYPFNFGIYHPIIQSNTNKVFFEALVNSIYRESEMVFTTQTEEIVQCLLRVILLKIKEYQKESKLKNHEINKSASKTFIRFQKLLEQPSPSSRNASHFCENLNISYKSLNSLCKELTGITLKKFIDNHLILKAKRSLISGQLNISEVAFSLGFEEVTNFTKYFRKHTSQTPSEFQNKIIKIEQ